MLSFAARLQLSTGAFRCQTLQTTRERSSNSHCRRRAGPVRAANAQDVRKLLRESLATPPAATTDTHLAVSDYLRGQGFQNPEEIIDAATNPHSIHGPRRSSPSVAKAISVEETKTVLDFLASKGLSQRQLVKVVSAHPPVLCYSLEGRLCPFFVVLTEAGIADPVKAVFQRPTLLGIEPNQNLRRIIGYLRETGHSPDSIAHLLATSI